MSEKEITRQFSKKITVASLTSFFVLAALGLITGNPHTHEILTALGPWVLGLIVTYMAVGYGDYRLSKGMPSLTDILTILITKRPHRHKEDSE
ncbi:hypothetical protein G3A39_38395 [Paraburkholderia aspalathi]|nr:hypothetical protein [Paraburkholderia aspalathi]